MKDVRQMECFDKVAKVIGVASAIEELQKVEDEANIDYFSNRLIGSFVWEESPQGHQFWYDVNMGVVPIDYDRESIKQNTKNITEIVIDKILNCDLESPAPDEEASLYQQGWERGLIDAVHIIRQTVRGEQK